MRDDAYLKHHIEISESRMRLKHDSEQIIELVINLVRLDLDIMDDVYTTPDYRVFGVRHDERIFNIRIYHNKNGIRRVSILEEVSDEYREEGKYSYYNTILEATYHYDTHRVNSSVALSSVDMEAIDIVQSHICLELL